ncbi:MAG: LysR family glycine cleavage system transcriptional activator [Gammaproteobacteria bacterium]|jgi:LysR family glycine cleavage system transcriptional activator
MAFRQIPSYNWLRVFEAAARFQSFTRAADSLAMSPAAVSQQIKSLEIHLSQPLFIRGPKSVSLTDAGKAFLPVVQQSLRAIETTAAALFGNPEQETLSVSSSLLFNCSWLANRIKFFQTGHPHVHVQLTTADDIPGYSWGEKDLQITYAIGPAYNQEGDRLFGETLYPVAHKDIASQIKSHSDLLNFQLIEINTHRTSWFQVLSEDNSDHIGQARFCFADNTVLALSMAAAGFGIALARAPASDDLCNQFGLVPCLPGFSINSTQSYYLIYNSLDNLSPVARSFRNWIIEPGAALC